MPQLTDEELIAIANRQVQIPGNPATTISARQNNPGNIKFSPNDPYSMGAGTRGFSIYKNPEEGYAALQDLIDRYYKPKNLNIAQMGEIYAPRFENDTDNWIKTVSQITGYKPDTPINQIPTPDLARGIVAIESSTRIPSSQPNLKLQPGPSDEELMAIAGKAQSKPQPGKVQSIPEIVGPALQQAPTDPMAESLGMFQPGNLMPSKETLTGQIPIAGAMITAPFKSSPILAPIAGLGMAGGGLIQRAIQGKEEEPTAQEQSMMEMGLPFATKGMLRDFGIGMGAELTGQGTQKVIEKAAAPFVKYFDKVVTENAAAKTAQDLVKEGVPISPDLIAPSRTSKVINWILENIYPANAIMAKKRKEIYEAANVLKDQFGAEYGVGKTSKELTNRAYDAFTETAGDIKIPMNKTIAIIRENLNQPFTQVGKAKDFWQGVGKSFAEMENEVDAQAIRNLATASKGGTSMDRTARNKVLSAIHSDLATFDKETGSTLHTIYTDADKTNKLFKRIKPVEDLLEASMVHSSSELGASLFNPSKFVNLWESRKARLESGKALSSADISLIDDFANKLKTMLPDLSRAGKYRQTQEIPMLSGAGLQRSLGTAPGAVGATIGTSGLWLLPMGATTGMAYSIMNPSGLLRRWLTSGLTPPKLISKELPKLGTLEEMND